MRLFCLPYAGGGAAAYRTWQSAFPAHIQIAPLLLPGRENRLAEPLFRNTTDLVAALVEGIQPFVDRPYAFFGHSMGALLAFEATRLMRRRGMRLPKHLVLSSHRAPHLPLRGKQIHRLNSADLRVALRDLGGTPKEVLDHDELMAIAEPILRADFELCETYVYTPDAPLDIPMSVFGGTVDPDIPEEDLEAWREQTSAQMRLQMFPGHHLYLHDERDALIREIEAKLGA
jgi:surfactin synthase thioesterase subunit